MHAYRFYIPPDLLDGSQARITGPNAHHAINVLRMKEGDTIVLFDGEAWEYSGKISSIKRGELVINEVEKTREVGGDAPHITLFTGLLPKFDFIVEKATELGVSEIVPLVTSRTEVQIKGDAANKKAERWKSVAIAASMQSGRIVLPKIHPPMDFDDALKSICHGSLAMIASLRTGTHPIIDVLEGIEGTPEEIELFVGPPSDFTEDEMQAAKAAGLIAVRLLGNTLRTETAAISALAITSSFFYSRSSDE